MRIVALLLVQVVCIRLVVANVEKITFIAPAPINIPQQQLNLANVYIETLTPNSTSLRRELPAAFPSPGFPKGRETWIVLDGLRQHQRYELRICWAATVSNEPILFVSHNILVQTLLALPTILKQVPELLQQPTSFVLDAFTLSEVFGTQELIDSLTSHSMRQQSAALWHVAKTTEATISDLILYLRISVAADYYTADKALMQHVPPVRVEISAGISTLLL
ncbi:MAG: hypothetical protein Q9163_001266 [Psora crenata]